MVTAINVVYGDIKMGVQALVSRMNGEVPKCRSFITRLSSLMSNINYLGLVYLIKCIMAAYSRRL